MPDFYDSSYRNFSNEVYAEVRHEAFGDDLGQNSWLTAEELERFAEWLRIGEAARVLDVACGSGGPALRLADIAGCHVHGIDSHGDGITQANAMAVSRGLEDRARFGCIDATTPLPFPEAAFDAVICVDAINHFPDRTRLLQEWARVVKPGGRVLFTDPIVITGALSHKEIAARSLIGYFMFVPPGEDERRIREAGLELVRAEDATPNVCEVAGRWLAARREREQVLRQMEGAGSYDETQEFLTMVELLARERRLSRFVFVAQRPEQG
jgi:SAM-dependent methyltransferase